MTHFIHVADVPAGAIFLADGDKYLLLEPGAGRPQAINMRGQIRVFPPDKLVRLADKGAVITIRQN